MLFACIFVPDFAAEALVRGDPDLRDAAVAVVEGKLQLLTVVAANERARNAGVECGMTNVQAAARLNRSATTAHPGVLRRRSPLQELAAHAALVDCARAISPRVEECAATPDTVLLDLEGLERLFGTPRKIASELARRASDLGLEANIAISENLDSAICAARGFGGITVLPRGKEPERLAPLPVEVLLQVVVQEGVSPEPVPRAKRKKSAQQNAGVKQISSQRASEILETLDRWGVRTFRALAALPETAVAERLGPEGVYLQKLCRGEGTRTLVPTEKPLVFEETIELEYPIDDLEPLAFVLSRLLEQLCARLSARALSTNELRLRMELENGGDYNIAESSRIAQPATYERALRLPVPMLDAKIFLRLWQLELRAKPPAAAVARVWLRAEPVQPRNTQGGLFLPSAPEPERLELTLARIAAVVGDNNAENTSVPDKSSAASPRKVGAPFDAGKRFERSTHTVTKPPLNQMVSFKDKPIPLQDEPDSPALPNETTHAIENPGKPRIGSPEILDTHRSDAFRMGRFSPPSSSGPIAAGAQSTGTVETRNARPSTTAVRLFRPPLAANVDVIDGRPAWLQTTRHQHTAQALSGDIAWCSGPWRTSGEWWNESWSREEWDVAVDDKVGCIVCRVYRDEQAGAWFVEGVYD